MGILLYGTEGPNVAKTRAGLILKELPYAHIDVELIEPSAEFSRLTPVKKVPVIQDGEVTVNDSLFIAEYLDRAYANTYPLFPQHLETRVGVYTVIALLERAFMTVAPLVAARLGFLELGEERAARSGYYAVSDGTKEALLGQFLGQREYLERTLDGKRRFFDARTTQADIAVFAFLTLMKQVLIDVGSLEGWRASVERNIPFRTMFECPENSIQGKV